MISRGLASFVRSLLFGDSPYDRFIAGSRDSLSPTQRLGLEVFRGKGNCTACHVGPNFTDESLHNTGVAWKNGRLADDGGGQGRFKTPTLREIARTAPYMHDGSIATLDEVIPRSATDELLHAIGQPQILWTQAGHYSSVFYLPAIRATVARFICGKSVDELSVDAN